ncbi:hypothetical protein RDABS01_036779 [Bienertia sinuspersici]
MEAHRGYDPSFTWKSLWGAKTIIKEELAWRVGNGLHIKVWGDKWVMKEGYPKYLSENTNGHPETRVANLVDFKRGSWNRDLVGQMFEEEERGLILNTPRLNRWLEDRWFWWPCSNGLYTVKSGYWLAKLGHVQSWFDEAHMQEQTCWRLVLNLSGPLKLRHFVWQACEGALAVVGRLYDRHILDFRICPVCGCPNETVIHALLFCKHTQEIWAKTNFPQLISEAPVDSFAEVLLWMATKVRKEELITSVTLAWATWNFKVNVDAHVSRAWVVGLRMVVWDHMGEIKAVTLYRFKARWKAELAEERAALYGVQVAVQLGFSKIMLECDSIKVVQAISTEEGGFTHFLVL